ncbi:MAG: hypothetical protein ACTSYA_00070 [Candidatus Kariarchaeaceae archaeon]
MVAKIVKVEKKVFIVFSILVYCIAINTFLTGRLSVVCEIEKDDDSESSVCFNVFGEYETVLSYYSSPIIEFTSKGETPDDIIKTSGVIIMISWVIGALSTLTYLIIKTQLYSKIQILLVAIAFISSLVATMELIISLNAMHNLHELYKKHFHDQGYWGMIILMLSAAVLSGLSLIDELKIIKGEFTQEEKLQEIEKKIMQEKAMQQRELDDLSKLDR